MLRLKRLEFENIRSFVGINTVDFDGRDKLIQIDGLNENTGGSSGAGKSTVFMALSYLLGINDIPATTLQSRFTKDPMRVIGYFVLNDAPITISRSKKNGLSVQIGDETVSGSTKVAEEKLDEIIGIPRGIFKKMIYKQQKEGGFFLNMTGKEVYEFLVEVTGLNGLIEKSVKTTKLVKEAENKFNEVNNEFRAVELSVADLNNVIKSKQTPIKPSATYEYLEQLVDGVDVITGDIDTISSKMNKELEAVEKPSAAVSKYDNSILNSLNIELAGVKDTLAAARDTVSKLNLSLLDVDKAKAGLEESMDALKISRTQYLSIEKSICPTCAQQWLGNAAANKLDSIRDYIAQLSHDIDKYKSVISSEADIKQNIDRAIEISLKSEEKVNAVQIQITEEQFKKHTYDKDMETKYALEMSAYTQTISDIKSKYRDLIEEKQREKTALVVELGKIRAELENYNKELDRYNKEVNDLNILKNRKELKLQELGSRTAALEKEFKVAGELKRLIKSYILQTLQDTLDSIGDSATEILSNLPNMSTSTIYFEGCKENKDGSIKDEITAIINIDGTNAVPIKSLSGGEGTAADLAVDLAVIDVIESKTNKGADFYITDEPFDGLDSVCKENCLEILKQLDTSKKIIMVDHSSELKEMVSDVITIVKSGENSRVVA